MQRLLCSCGWDVTPKFQGDTGFVFHVFGGHQVTVSCERKIGPFDCCSVVQGDCLELMKQLPDGCVDAVITDPPYGIREASGKNASRGHKAAARNYGVSDWDDSPCSTEQISELRRVSGVQVVFGGNYFELPPSKCWLVWDKRTKSDFSDCELAWTNLPTDTILDPFAGSGTTLVAAKKLGRHFIGFEISPEYCQIARDRLARIDAQPSLFTQPPQQMTIEDGQ
jgi:predicted RNA methylase